MKNLLIIGSGGHAKSVIDAAEANGNYFIIGLVDDFEPVGTKKHGYDVLGGIDGIKSVVSRSHDKPLLHIAVGNNKDRNDIFNRLNLDSSLFATIIHPTAYVSKHAAIGYGVFLGAYGFVNAGTTINNFCIVNTRSSLDHDCTMMPFSALAPSVTCAGYVKIGKGSQISTGATLANKVTIGNRCIIGGGSFVKNDVLSDTFGYGVPFEAKTT